MGVQGGKDFGGGPARFVLYATQDGRVKVECRFEGETLWLSQASMAELFAVDKSGVSRHLRSIFDSGELSREAVVALFATTASDGKTYAVEHYNLDAIISVGYRVNSVRGTQFRIWATQVLREFLLKGFAMDDQRLKNPPVGASEGPDRFDEMLERIRDIRASERRMYLRVREIFALAADYQPTLKATTSFFRVIQNKMHFAVTGRTAAELIAERADPAQPNMGLTTWQGERVQRGDITVAKNYLREQEITELNRIVTMWLDYAEDQAIRKKQVFLKDWEYKLDHFLAFNERRVLGHAGSISKAAADAKAGAAYAEFEARRRTELEAKGEEENIKLLMEAARLLEGAGRGKPD